jgi:hypothetical protein
MDLDTYIKQNFSFDRLPQNVKQVGCFATLLHARSCFFQKALGNSKKEWEKAVVEYSKAHQLRYKGNLGASACRLSVCRVLMVACEHSENDS